MARTPEERAVDHLRFLSGRFGPICQGSPNVFDVFTQNKARLPVCQHLDTQDVGLYRQLPDGLLSSASTLESA